MTDEQAGRVVALLELIARRLGASPHAVRTAGQVREASVEPTDEQRRSRVSVVRPGRGARLVPDMRHPHEIPTDETGLPAAGGHVDPETFWKRRAT